MCICVVLAAGGAAVWAPGAWQDHPGSCDCASCWVLRGGDERKVSGREASLCPDSALRPQWVGGGDGGVEFLLSQAMLGW